MHRLKHTNNFVMTLMFCPNKHFFVPDTYVVDYSGKNSLVYIDTVLFVLQMKI